jgi:hypothetical protein
MTRSASQSEPPEARIIGMVMAGWTASIIAETSRHGVPDILKKHGPLTADQIVSVGGADALPDALGRMLRAAASVGVLTEDGDGRFGLTELSEVLTTDSKTPVKKLVEGMGGPWLKMMTELFDAVRTGKSQSPKLFGMEWWDYLNANPKELEDFGEAMKANSHNSTLGVLGNCDLGGVETISDVGGGFGHLAVALLGKYPNLKASVFDLPDLVPVAKASFPIENPDVAQRLEYIGGDMFQSVPPAQVYIMKHIIHDWENEHCLKLLRNCHANMQGEGRIVCVDSVIPPMGDTGNMPAKLIDLLMLSGINGRERTEAQWRELYGEAGFEISRITAIDSSFGTSIIEGVKSS